MFDRSHVYGDITTSKELELKSIFLHVWESIDSSPECEKLFLVDEHGNRRIPRFDLDEKYKTDGWMVTALVRETDSDSIFFENNSPHTRSDDLSIIILKVSKGNTGNSIKVECFDSTVVGVRLLPHEIVSILDEVLCNWCKKLNPEYFRKLDDIVIPEMIESMITDFIDLYDSIKQSDGNYDCQVLADSWHQRRKLDNEKLYADLYEKKNGSMFRLALNRVGEITYWPDSNGILIDYENLNIDSKNVLYRQLIALQLFSTKIKSILRQIKERFNPEYFKWKNK